MILGGAEILVFMLAWLLPLAVAVYVLLLANRHVRAVERIADRLDRAEWPGRAVPRDDQGEPVV